MIRVKEVKLKNFRCHEDFALDLNRPTSLIIGANGSGKTSILEAIYLALRGKSFKGVDREIEKEGADFYRAEIVMKDARKVIIRYNGTKKEFEVDGTKSLRLPKKYRYPIVLFEPDDLYLVGSSPSRRRDYFDELFKQMDANYGVALGKYNKALKQRNDFLKAEECAQADIFPWNVMLAHYGAFVASQRQKYLALINDEMTELYREIAKNEDSCELKYLGMDLTEDKYMQILERNFEKDRILGYTSFGVHRDDYEFEFNNKKADGSASRGEVRSIILALKFLEAKILEQETGYAPLVLLDDIFSELDENRQRHLVENFKKYQTVITSVMAPAGLEVSCQL